MRVFVYLKRTSKKIEQIDDVTKIRHNNKREEIVFYTADGSVYKFDTKIVKTTTFQN